MDFKETLDYLYAQLPMFQRVGKTAFKKDLTNTVAFCEHLGHPEKKFRTIHVAGTNGKGSVSHFLAAILRSAGYKTGLYTSPHLKSFTERIRINGETIPEQNVVDFVLRHRNFLEELKPSFFEATVAMAFNYFAEEEVDVAVIETGLGGRLDSTNVIHPLISIITNISFDHQDMLGETLPEIAFEKAGIIKPKIPVVIGEYQPEIREVFRKKALETNSEIFFAEKHFKVEIKEVLPDGLLLEVYQQNHPIPRFSLTSGLSGMYQTKNLQTVFQAIDVLKRNGLRIEDKDVVEGVHQVVKLTGLKGRWQILGKQPLVICDTGHNAAGLDLVLKQLLSLSYRSLTIIFGMVKDKDPHKILSIMPRHASYYFSEARIPRALAAAELAEKATEYGLRGSVEPDVNKAIQKAKEGSLPDDLIFIGGSNFIVAEIDDL
jgi:dihydrofolate synthase/folylpolyglutamate synthase